MAHSFSFKASKQTWITFFKRNLFTKESLPIIGILFLAAFLRLYKISDYMTFLGDEGRDVLVAKQILEGNLTFLGPRASAGDFYLGPIYYYFMTPFLLLFNYDPVGPAIMVALAGIVTVFLVYYITKEWINKPAGIIAAALYTVSPLVIAYSRSSWNPNLMPIITLTLLYVLYKAVVRPSWKLFLAVGILFGIAMQLHYIELFMAFVIFFFTLFGRIIISRKFEVVLLFKSYAQMILGFLISFSPFIAFEVKNGFPNIRTIFSFVINPATGDPALLSKSSFLEIVGDVFFRLFARLSFRFPEINKIETFDQTVIFIWSLGIICIAVLSIISLLRIKNNVVKLLLVLWLVFGVILFGFYKKSIYDYYFEFMFPLPFILIGGLFSYPFIKKSNAFFKGSIVVIVAAIFIWNLLGMPFLAPPNKQKDQVKNISEFVLSQTNDKPYNFALLTPGNSDHGYRYFFEVAEMKPVEIENPIKDPHRTSVTEQLLIVCEDLTCSPLGHPLFEVAGFGRAEIADIWDLTVVKVYKLVPFSGKNTDVTPKKISI